MHGENWLEYLLSWGIIKYAYLLAGSLTGSFGQNKNNERSGIGFLKFAASNAVIATACSAIVFPLSAELGLNSNWEHILLFFAGYMGLGFIDMVQARVRFFINQKLGETNGTTNVGSGDDIGNNDRDKGGS